MLHFVFPKVSRTVCSLIKKTKAIEEGEFFLFCFITISCFLCVLSIYILIHWARFSKKKSSAIQALMGGENSMGDLLIMRTLKNSDTARSFP